MDIKYILNYWYIPKRFHNQLNIMRDYSLIAKSETTMSWKKIELHAYIIPNLHEPVLYVHVKIYVRSNTHI